MSNYIKKYNLGNIMVDLPYDSYIHELPLLSFSDYRNSVNISLVFNKRLQSIDTAACTNTFNIKEGFKLNIQKKVYLDDNDLKYKYIDSSGKVITLINNGGVYTFDDDSKRILKVISSGYIVENYDFSKEEFNNNGLLLNVYDKYGDLYLAYTYNSSNLLTSVTYNGKSVMFSYESNVLNEISYDETTTKITCVDNILIVEHYNLAVYVCSITGNDYVVEAKPSKNSVTEYMKSCTFENNTIQLIEKIGTEIMDYIKYTFPQNVTGNYKYYKQVEITNFLGAKQRIQFKDKKVLYSYVIDPDASFSENRIYEGNVTINMIDNEIDDFKFNGTLRYNDGLQMRYDLSNPNVWYCDRSSFNNYNGKYLVTGWVKSSDSLMATINISNILGVEQDTYNIPLNALNQWHFFAFQFPFTGNYMYISPTQSTVELSDVRLNYHSYEIYDQSINSNCLYYEDILFIGNQRVPFSEISFSYTKNGQRFNIENITLSDLLKYKLELIKAVNNNLLYYKDSKNVINGITNLEVLYNGQYIDIDDISVGTRCYSKGKEYYTKISKSGMTASLIIVSNHLGDRTYAYQYLNEYFDTMILNEDGITVNYTRDKGLITQENVGSLYNIVTIYTPTMITVKDTLATGVKYDGINYYIDPVWGSIIKTEYSDGTIIEDTYDGDKSAIKKKTFNKSSNQNVIDFGYSNELLISLTNSNLNYGFEYNDNNKKIKLIKKFGSAIFQQLNEYKCDKYYFPNKDNEVYSKEYKYNKYGYLTEITNELKNTYASNQFLVKSQDIITNLIMNYYYNSKGLVAYIATNESNNEENIISNELFTYDKENRLTTKEFKYNVLTNQSVKDEMIYVKDEDDVVKDQRLSETLFHINNSETLNTKNQYDSYKRLTKKTYLLDLGREEEYSKRFTYTNNKLSKVKNEKGEEVLYNYDSHGRINSIQNINKLITYDYDDFGRLIRENNKPLDRTIVYEYNDIGNITRKKEYSYTTSQTLSNYNSLKLYAYDTTQKDRLTNYNFTNITYDALGCPTNLNGYNLTWNKGKLIGLSKGDLQSGIESYTYTYNAYGQRVSKTYSKTAGTSGLNQFFSGEIINYSKTYTYDSSGRLIREATTNTYYSEGIGTEEIIYIYDLNTIIGMKYTVGNNSNTYYFDRNALGDVEAIYDLYGNLKVKYLYDAYGNCTISSETTNQALARVNPIRYRGYYYDVETGLFWISSRYYNPEWGRFIQPADVSSLDPQSINGLNLYTYANNNPIGIAYSSSSIGGRVGGSKVSTLALGGVISGGSSFVGSNNLSIKFPSQNWLSLGIDFTAGMSGALSVLGWTLKNPEFYEFWYSAYGISKYEMLSNLKSPMTKIASVISYGLVAYDTYTDVMGHINAGDSWQKTTASGMITAGVGAFNVWASAKVGAAVGTAIGGVPGFIIGTAAGVVVGIVINGIFYTEINGKSIAGYIEDGIEGLLEWLF